MEKEHTYTVTETARRLQLSRARFYELLRAGVFPKPLRKNNKPYYDRRLYERCRQIKSTGTDIQGRPVIFYKPRGNHTTANKKSGKKNPEEHNQLYRILVRMGIECSEKRFLETLKTIYPDGFEKQDMPLVIKKLYKRLCKFSV